MKNFISIFLVMAVCILAVDMVMADEPILPEAIDTAANLFSTGFSPVVTGNYTGMSSAGIGVRGESATGIGVTGSTTSGTAGVYGENMAETGTGVYGSGYNGVSGSGYNGVSGTGYTGVFGTGMYNGVKGNFSIYSDQLYGVLGELRQVAIDANGDPLYELYGAHGCFLSLGPEALPVPPFVLSTIGVLGENEHANGIGVKGRSTTETGYGVYGQNTAGGYAVYAEGDVKVTGGIRSPATTNLALLAVPTASSEYNANYAAAKLIDGLYMRWDYGEHATFGEKAGAWVQLNWDPAVTINKVKIYPRPNKYDQIFDSHVLVQTVTGLVTDIHTGIYTAGGTPKELTLSVAEGTNVVALKVLITEVSPETQNIGLAEIECFFNPILWE